MTTQEVDNVSPVAEWLESLTFNYKVLGREGSIITIPPITITITHSCNRFSITIISPCNRYDYDYDYITSLKLKNGFATAFTKSELIKK